MSAREHIVEQFEMSQMAKNGVYLFSTNKELEDDLNSSIVSKALMDAFKTNGVSLSGKISITKEKEDKVVITDKERQDTFFVRKKDEKLNFYNSVSKYKKIELPEIVITKTKNVTMKQPKSRGVVIEPLKPKEIIENGRKITKVMENVPIVKMRNTNKIASDMQRKGPIIYYSMMVFSLVSAIIGAASYPAYYSYGLMIGGIGVFLVAFMGILEFIYIKRKLKIAN